MLTNSDKAWASGLAAWVAGLLQVKLGWTFVTPELAGLVAGALVYWLPNKP